MNYRRKWDWFRKRFGWNLFLSALWLTYIGMLVVPGCIQKGVEDFIYEEKWNHGIVRMVYERAERMEYKINEIEATLKDLKECQ